MRILPLFGALLISALAACGVSSSEDAEQSEANINGSLSTERACAVRDAYLRASLSDLQLLTPDELPAGVRKLLGDFRWGGNKPEALASMEVRGVGTVYIIEQTDGVDARTNLDFVDASGDILVYGLLEEGQASFSSRYANDDGSGITPLRCSGDGASSSGGPLLSADGGAVDGSAVDAARDAARD